MNSWRAILRGGAISVLIASHIAVPALTAFFKSPDLPKALQWRKILSKRMLRVLGVKVEVQTPLPTETLALYVGNHRSYLDPIVIMKDIKVLPVAKLEVASWPLIGIGAKATGVILVHRESKSSRGATIAAMKQTIEEGHPVLIYPEGTTHTQPTTIEFRRGTFALAAAEGIPIVPVAVDYFDMSSAWVDDDSFLGHFFRCFSKKETRVKIRYGTPLYSNDADYLLKQTQQWIDENMVEIRDEFEGKIVSHA